MKWIVTIGTICAVWNASDAVTAHNWSAFGGWTTSALFAGSRLIDMINQAIDRASAERKGA